MQVSDYLSSPWLLFRAWEQYLILENKMCKSDVYIALIKAKWFSHCLPQVVVSWAVGKLLNWTWRVHSSKKWMTFAIAHPYFSKPLCFVCRRSVKFDQQGVIESEAWVGHQRLYTCWLILSLPVKTVHRSKSPFSTTLTQFVLFPTVTKQISKNQNARTDFFPEILAPVEPQPCCVTSPRSGKASLLRSKTPASAWMQPSSSASLSSSFKHLSLMDSCCFLQQSTLPYTLWLFE